MGSAVFQELVKQRLGTEAARQGWGARLDPTPT